MSVRAKISQPGMNNKMSTLLQRAGLCWPLVTHSIPKHLPPLEIFEDCVLLKDQWDPNGHLMIKDCFDKTDFECLINHVHLPFDGTNETLISCLEHAATLQEALIPLAADRKFRVIVSVSEDDEFPKSACVVRFHQIRPGENWMAENLEEFKSEAILTFDVPSSSERLSLAT
jgi:hypothetical protein